MSATQSWAKSPEEHDRNVAINEARVADAAFPAADWSPTDYLPGGEYAGGLAGAHGAELTPELLAGLPDPLREMCEAVAATRGAPISAAVAMGLAALGGACGGIARVQPFPDDNPSWHEPVSVSVAIIMASGTGKTGLGADFIGGHGEYADRLRLQSADAMRRAAARVKASKRRLPDLERQAGKDGAEGIAGLDALEREIADIEQAEKDARGPRPVLVGTNVTPKGWSPCSPTKGAPSWWPMSRRALTRSWAFIRARVLRAM